MKKVVLEVEEKKYRFFMEVLKNFQFVNIVKEDVAKKEAIKKIAEGMHGALQASKGQIKSRPAKAFLDEL